MATSKAIVAVELFDRALRLYFEGGSDYAALHLAGAAEELLGHFAEQDRFTLDGQRWQASKAIEDWAEAIEDFAPESVEDKRTWAIRDLKSARNETKHADRSSEVEFDARVEAHQMLDRALSNFIVARQHPLMFDVLVETENIRRFASSF